MKEYEEKGNKTRRMEKDERDGQKGEGRYLREIKRRWKEKKWDKKENGRGEKNYKKFITV